MLYQTEKFNFQRLLKTFRRIGYAILLLFGVLFLIIIFGKMNDEVSGKGIVAGIREYDLKALDTVIGKIVKAEETAKNAILKKQNKMV